MSAPGLVPSDCPLRQLAHPSHVFQREEAAPAECPGQGVRQPSDDVPGSGVPTPQEPEITEEMIERAARSLADHIDQSMPTPGYLREYAREALAAALAGRTVVPARAQADLSAFDPSELNALAATMTELRGYIPLSVRFGAAAAALAYVDRHDPASRDPLTNNDDGSDEYARAVAVSQSEAPIDLGWMSLPQEIHDAAEAGLASESRKDGETPPSDHETRGN